MSSQENSNNDAFYKQRHPEQEEPELSAKTRSLIRSAVESNNLEELKSLITESQTCNIAEDNFGYNLLQIAISQQNTAIFDFLLSKGTYSCNCDDGVVTLKKAMRSDLSDHFLKKLIDNGANIHIRCDDSYNTLLHLAAEELLLTAAEVLIKGGADINDRNAHWWTPLITVFRCSYAGQSKVADDFVSLLLYYRADVTIRDLQKKNAFDLALRMSCYDKHTLNMQENLLFFTLDEYSDYKISVHVLFDFFRSHVDESIYLYQILDHLKHIDVNTEGLEPYDVNHFAHFLFFIEMEYLQVLMDRFPKALSQILQISSQATRPLEEYFFNTHTIENFKLMLESDLAQDCVQYIVSRIRIEGIIGQRSQHGIVDLICYLLTYGMRVFDDDLEAVFKKFGYCDLFKVLLHMDIQKNDVIQRDIIPAVIYDVSLNIERFLDDPHNYSLNSIYQLLDYFALPKLKALCYKLNIEKLVSKANQLPQVPRLEEFARDATRKFLITKFNVQTTKHLYSIIRWLPVAGVHKKIISFESKLYWTK